MNDASVDKKTAITLHEVCTGETLAHILHLRIAEREPNLLHLVRTEEAVDDLDVGAKECHILKSVVKSLRCTCPHTCALDVDTDEVDIRI